MIRDWLRLFTMAARYLSARRPPQRHPPRSLGEIQRGVAAPETTADGGAPAETGNGLTAGCQLVAARTAKPAGFESAVSAASSAAAGASAASSRRSLRAAARYIPAAHNHGRNHQCGQLAHPPQDASALRYRPPMGAPAARMATLAQIVARPRDRLERRGEQGPTATAWRAASADALCGTSTPVRDRLGASCRRSLARRWRVGAEAIGRRVGP